MARQKRGASLTGYGLIVGLVAVAALFALDDMGNSIDGIFGSAETSLEQVVDGGAEAAPSASAAGLSVAVPIPDQDWSVFANWGYAVPSGTFSEPSATLAATLANGDPLPSWLSFDGSAFDGAPPGNAPATLDLRITASANGDEVSDDFQLAITPLQLDAHNSFTTVANDTIICDNTQTGNNNTRPSSCTASWVIPADNVTGIVLVVQQNPGLAASGCHTGRWDGAMFFLQGSTRIAGGGFAESYQNYGNYSWNGVRFDASAKYCRSSATSGSHQASGQCSGSQPDDNPRKTLTYTYLAGSTDLQVSTITTGAGGSPYWDFGFPLLQAAPTLSKGDSIRIYPAAQPAVNECSVASSQNGEFQIISIDLVTDP